MKTILEVSIHQKGVNPIFGEGVTSVRIDDEAGGGFIILEQEDKEIRLDMSELEEIVVEARKLIMQYNKNTSEFNKF